MRRLASVPLLLALLLLPTSALGEGRALDVLVIDMGLRPGSESASRLRTLVQVMSPGIRVEKVHYRHIRPGYLERKDPKAVIVAPPRATWKSFPSKRLEQLREALKDYRGALLGIGGGHQLVATAWGGEVAPMANEAGEEGTVTITVERADPILDGLPARFEAVEGHHDEVTSLPPGFVLLATSEASRHQLMRHESRRIYGVQFHPEAPQGARLPAKQLLRNFLHIARVVTR